MNFGDSRLPLRFWDKCSPEPMSGCWLWTGTAINNRGRVQLIDGRPKTVSAYRMSYESLVGPIAAGLTIDHVCQVTLCVNPAHLEAVTVSENSRRYWQRNPTSKTHCSRGHDLAVVGTWRKGTRDGAQRHVCRECHRIAVAKSLRTRDA